MLFSNCPQFHTLVGVYLYISYFITLVVEQFSFDGHDFPQYNVINKATKISWEGKPRKQVGSGPNLALGYGTISPKGLTKAKNSTPPRMWVMDYEMWLMATWELN